MIHKFRVSNFKSIREVTVELSEVTVLVGRSGTGKSNFVESLRTLRDLVASGERLWNELPKKMADFIPATNPSDSTLFELTFSIAGMEEFFTYLLQFSPHPSPNKSQHRQVMEGHPQTTVLEERLQYGQSDLFHLVIEPGKPKWIVVPDLVRVPQQPKGIMLGSMPSLEKLALAYAAIATGIGCYGFEDTVLANEPSQRQSSKEHSFGLDDSATNFLDVLRVTASDLQHLTLRRSVVSALQKINPTVASIELNDIRNPTHVVVGHSMGDKTLDLKLSQESSGFRRCYAHLLALYQQPPKQSLIFEHPEDGIHPGALALLAEEFKSAPNTGRGQVILTTHSPELLNHFSADEIRVVELAGLETKIGPVADEQREAVLGNLLDAGELLTVDPARIRSATAQ